MLLPSIRKKGASEATHREKYIKPTRWSFDGIAITTQTENKYNFKSISEEYFCDFYIMHTLISSTG